MTTSHDTTAVLRPPAFPAKIANRYLLEQDEPLGSGGMSIVYLGWDLQANRHVALRTLRDEFRQDELARGRFRREMRTMAFVQHPNIARVYDLIEDDETLWATIEYAAGRTLKEVLAERGTLDVRAVQPILDQLCDAVATLHDHGLVHLDIKPQNIIVDQHGTLKLFDFGLAQPAGQPQELLNGVAFGTAAYLSPEQAAGSKVVSASDTYAIGCVLFDMLTGSPPFIRPTQGGPEAVVSAHLTTEPDPPSTRLSSVPASIDALLLWSLDKSPMHRLEDPRLLAALYRQGIDGQLDKSDVIALRNDALGVNAPAHIPTGVADEEVLPVASAAKHDTASRQRSKWKTLAALVSAVALVLCGLYLTTGRIPPLYGGYHAFRPGGSATVGSQALNLRAAPGVDQTAIATLTEGSRVQITGSATTVGFDEWLPVRTGTAQDPVSGFVWVGGLVPETVSGFDHLSDTAKNQYHRLRDIIAS